MRHVVVTGAASGIGLATATRLAPEVDALTLLDRNVEGLESLAAQLRSQGPTTVASVALDLSDAAQLSRVVPTVVAASGPVTGFVHCAGIAAVKAFAEVTDQEWDEMLAINSRSTFSLLRSVGTHMAGEGGGSIVTLASVAATLARPQLAPYAASKAAVISLTMSAAAALAPTVRVNAVAPGIIATSMRASVDAGLAASRDVSRDRLDEELLATIPLARTGTADDVAKVIIFLLGADAGYVTGQCLRVDGGMAMYM